VARQLALAKKVSLAGIAEGWGEECFAMMMPADYPDILAADELNGKPKKEYVEWQFSLLKKKFVSGKVKLLNGELVDMEADDITASITITDRLFSSFLGEDADPKADAPAPSPADKPQSVDEPTETPSSPASDASPEPTSGS
jgi:hypothetical protein